MDGDYKGELHGVACGVEGWVHGVVRRDREQKGRDERSRCLVLTSKMKTSMFKSGKAK